MKARMVLRESIETLKEGYGFLNQRDDCSTFASNHKIEVAKEHQLIESSSTWKRERFDQIVKEAIEEKEEIPIIVFPRVDRFARNLEAAAYYLGLLRREGLVVMFAQENLVVDEETSTTNVFMFFLHEFKADEDGKQIRHNLLGGRDKLIANCQVPNGNVIWCFDYAPKRIYGQMTDGKPKLNKKRANWVKEWAKWIIDDGMGLYEICRKMNEIGVTTKRGGKFGLKAIRDILRSKQLMGEFRWKGELYYRDEALRVLTNEEFDALQRRLDENRQRSYYNARKYYYPPLRKMVFCSCGQLMYGVPEKGRVYYRCRKCSKRVNALTIWGQVRDVLKEELLREERLIPALKTQFDSKDTLIRLEEDIKGRSEEIQIWENAKDKAFRMGMALPNYPTEKVREQIDKADEHIRYLGKERAGFEAKRKVLKNEILNEEGIKRFCKVIAGSIENLTQNQWEVLLKLLELRLTVYTKEYIIANLALPPMKTTEAEIEFSQS